LGCLLRVQMPQSDTASFRVRNRDPLASASRHPYIPPCFRLTKSHLGLAFTIHSVIATPIRSIIVVFVVFHTRFQIRSRSIATTSRGNQSEYSPQSDNIKRIIRCLEACGRTSLLLASGADEQALLNAKLADRQVLVSCEQNKKEFGLA
jgi:hypothetical protein